MAKSCPNCGTLAVSTDEMYQSRRVYACSEGICGLKFITKSGKLIRVSQTPWIKYEEDKKDNKMENMEKRIEISAKFKTLIDELNDADLHGTAAVLSLAGMSLFIPDEFLAELLITMTSLVDDVMLKLTLIEMSRAIDNLNTPDGYADKKSMEK